MELPHKARDGIAALCPAGVTFAMDPQPVPLRRLGSLPTSPKRYPHTVRARSHI